MNETNHPASTADMPWSPDDQRVPVPDTPMPPGSEKAGPATAGVPRNAAQGAPGTIDRIADSAAPAVRHMGESVPAAGETLHAKTDRLRERWDEWVEGVRTTVRSSPLASIATALALGAVIARITR